MAKDDFKINFWVYDSLGLATRLCDGNPAVWHDPNVENCSTVEITRITEEVNYLMAISAASRDPNNSDRTVVIESDVLQSITSELSSATNKSDDPILPNDLISIINTVGDLLRLFYIPTKILQVLST